MLIMLNKVGKTVAIAAAGAASLSVGMSNEAKAQTYNVYDILGAFDVIVPGTYQSQNDIEGAAMVGTLDASGSTRRPKLSQRGMSPSAYERSPVMKTLPIAGFAARW